MSLSFTEYFGSNERLTECFCVLYAEIIDCQGMRCWDGTIFVVTNLGELGDARHQAEPSSRHNLMLCPDGVWRCCACDFGGLFQAYTKIAQFFQALYKAHDSRVYPYGFCQFGDGDGLEWFTGNKKYTGRDQGHTHIDCNMADSSLANISSFVPSMTSRDPWGLAYFLTTGQLASNPTQEIQMTAADQAAINAHTDLMAIRNIVPLASAITSLRRAVDAGNAAVAVAASGLFAARNGAVFTQVEGGKAWLSWIDYYARGMPPVRKVGTGDPLLELTTVGEQPGDLRVVVYGGVTWAVQGSSRLRLDTATAARLLPNYSRTPATTADMALKEVLV